jgi:ribosome-associated toxin RatA of RatAB toxin-antitoxin module
MPVYEGSHRTVLPSEPGRAFDVMTDYERLPEWQGPLKRCEVLDRYPDGLARDVEYEVDVKLRTVTYRLRHSYDRPNRIGSEYLEGDFACFEGDWLFERNGDDRTEARLSLRIDPGFPVPGRVAKMLNRRVLKSSVEDLRKRLERS